MGMGISTTNSSEVSGRVVEVGIGSFRPKVLSTQRLLAQCSEVITSGRAICQMSCSRGALVPGGIQETPRVANRNGPQEGSCI